MLLNELRRNCLPPRTLPSLCGDGRRHRRLGHLLCGVIDSHLGLSLLLLRLGLLLHCPIHLLFNILLVELDVIQNPFLESPAEEVQLADRCEKRLVLRDLEENTLPPAERVKQLLAVRLELVLIVHIHGKLLSIQNVRGIVCLAVVRNKPVNEPQAHFTGSLQKINNLGNVLALAVEPLQA